MTATRILVTPEGVALSLRLGGAGQRLTGFLLDLLAMMAGFAAIALLAYVVETATGGSVGPVLWVLGSFLLRNLYFAAFELTPRAATPGKRLMGLRVAARDGGRLTGNAILARNLVREFELFLPLTMLVLRGTNSDGWLVVSGLGWTGIFLAFPLLNRDRLRVGDLLAGTWVVSEPRPLLLPDLAIGAAIPLRFSPAQVAAYGIKELHLLDEVLRRGDSEALATVAGAVRARIGWQNGREDDAMFLSAYYAALRKELERGLLLGRRKADKTNKA